MNKISKPIVFFGNERIATGVRTDAPLLRSLCEAGYNIVAVVSHYAVGQSRNVRSLEVAQVAEEFDIPVLLPEKPKDIIDELRAFGAEAGILVAYGKIIPQSVIDIFPKGIINIHPSLLPKHRGPTPLESVILQGETTTGVSIMALAKEMDAGPVYAQSEYQLSGHETKQELADALMDISCAMLLEVLPGILDGNIVAVPQDDSAATYDSLIVKEVSQLDFTKSADVLEREIRAFAQWPKSRTMLGDIEVVITAAHVLPDPTATPGVLSVDTAAKTLTIDCKEGKLVVDSLKPAGKGDMNIAGFLAGYGSRIKI
jgi:methionyl-tRNA formyltransferase